MSTKELSRSYEEGIAGGSNATAHDRKVWESIGGRSLRELSEAVARGCSRRGVSFKSAEGGAQAFRIDPIPRVIDAREWSELSAGVAQRVRALELFVRDVYSERRIVAAGIVPAAGLDSAQHYERELIGMGEQISSWITVAGLDVVRDSDGSFKVLEDNLRTPSGIAYAVATREVLGEHLPPPEELHVRSLDTAFRTLGEGLRAAAPAAAGEDPTVVLLSDGQLNSAFYEHATIAAYLGLPLVLLDQLRVRGGRLYARLPDGERAVDVVYRRTDEDRLRDDRGEPTPIARLLLEPILAGTLACVNAFGTGVADDKLMHAYVERMVRFYLGEEPILEVGPHVRPDPTRGARDGARADRRAGRQAAHRARRARRRDRAARAAGGSRPHRGGAARAPELFIAQETVMLSRHPTVMTGGGLELRHVDLRPFAISGGEGDGVHVLPGGLTRVAFERGALVVNSSQNGGCSKDTGSWHESSR